MNSHIKIKDWDEWEDEDAVTPIDNAEQVCIDPPPPSSQDNRNSKTFSSRTTKYSIKRLKSRRRQQAQNAKAGIKVITDMTTLQQQQNYMARHGKFANSAALRALEGEPNSASVGNWNWFKKDKTQSPQASKSQQLSPDARPIVIGIALPNEGQTHKALNGTHAHGLAMEQPKSVWSPDTPDTATSFGTPRSAASANSQNVGITTSSLPPVPEVPSTYKKDKREKLISVDMAQDDEDDAHTLFEEDGALSPEMRTKDALYTITPDSASSRAQGWWDHVVTPFTDKHQTFTTTRKQKLDSPQGGKVEPKALPAEPIMSAGTTSKKQLGAAVIVRAPTPRGSAPTQPLSQSDEKAVHAEQENTPSQSAHSAQMGLEKTFSVASQFDQPPPYSPPKKHAQNSMAGSPAQYRAYFPPGHPLATRFPASPSPTSPGLAATMTSQGATPLTDVPLTPTHNGTAAPLPTRPVGAYVPGDHAHTAHGRRNKVERQRRRYEKEDIVARRVGGLWRGRWCVPLSGCFGRSGAEGRKRRRVCLSIFSGIIALIILIIVLAVVLTRGGHTDEPYTAWVNLTDFPPMPTGVLTVVAPDNTVARSSCTAPKTLWSCALPREDHDSVLPYKPDQPTFGLHIEWDNNTQNRWNVADGSKPSPISELEVARRGASGASGATYASSVIRRRQASDEAPVIDFKPDPSPPSFEEMFFLGETTDNIQSEDKAGEATPFYISLKDPLGAGVELVKPTELLRRQEEDPKVNNISLVNLLPSPELDREGKLAPARMFPSRAVRQPLRLFDRGLATEHYGFYMHYNRTMYMRSTFPVNDTANGGLPIDENGGSTRTEARFLVTWAQTRLHMQIWTKKLDDPISSMLQPGQEKGINGTVELTRPGTMPWPVTVQLDTHGGDRMKKLTWQWPIDDQQRADVDNPRLLQNQMAAEGTRINPSSSGDEKFGGFDGGSGGCSCEWVNWSGA